MAGFAVRIRPGFKPVQRPETPDSATICRPVSNKLGADPALVDEEVAVAVPGVQSC